ncbi:hypothetical protein [Dysgonomonas sp. 520]|uniref:hypothetical protein n=1 Tax=Dysgonomonas sp. 520 TaxID=2302931 RepID=UPI0013D5A648|nr:hypothetical protein [Dysgonomonas sp. 520]NDW09963.1 hypothetical protein [Dysgonomonas sp. 520]
MFTHKSDNGKRQLKDDLSAGIIVVLVALYAAYLTKEYYLLLLSLPGIYFIVRGIRNYRKIKDNLK